MTQVFGKLVDDEDDQVEGVVPTTSRWWSKEGAWQGGGVDKGGAAAVYKMLIAPVTTLLAAKPLQKNPHFEKNGPTKLPSQMGHKGSGAVYRTFRPPCPARLPACLHQLCV